MSAEIAADARVSAPLRHSRQKSRLLPAGYEAMSAEIAVRRFQPIN